MLRQEMVAVNGTVMTEVLTLAQMVAGTFFVNTTHKLIYLWPPSGTNMSTASVNVATEPNLFTISGKSNIVVRGIVFQYANSCRSVPAVAVTGSSTFPPSNILFDTDTFQWNNGQGLAVNNPITFFTVENSTSVHNGDSGFQGYNTEFGLWQNDVTSFNNWRGAQGAYYACNVSGFHSWEAHTDTLNTFTSSYNQTYGIHWDTDNIGITGTGVISTQNLQPGLFAEKIPAPSPSPAATSAIRLPRSWAPDLPFAIPKTFHSPTAFSTTTTPRSWPSPEPPEALPSPTGSPAPSTTS